MRSAEDELVDEAHRAYVAITLQLGKRSFNQQKRALEALVAKYAPRLEERGLSEAVFALRRNAAEWLLHEAAHAKRPARAFEPLLRAIETIGWGGLYPKTLSIPAMCSYFADRMWRREGLRYLLPLKREVEQEYARTGDTTWANCLGRLAWTEERLRARRRPF